MASGIYNAFKANTMTSGYDMSNGGDAINCLLLDTNHAFDRDDDTYADIIANEISGTGYTAGGETLANQAVTTDDINARGVYDADDPSWTSASFTASHAVLYDDTAATDPLICSIDFGGDLVVVNGTFTIQWDSTGIIHVD